MFGSIRRRLTLGYVGILGFILLIFGATVVFGFYLVASNNQDNLLLERARSKSEDLLRDLDAGKDPRVATASDFDVACALVGVDPSATYAPEKAPPVAPNTYLGLPYEAAAQQAVWSETPKATTVPGADEGIRVVSVPLTFPGQGTLVVQAAQSRRLVLNPVRLLAVVFGVTGAGALALSAVGGLFMSRRAMRPVQDSFERQRTFIADASHELKTPLTLIRADAEVLSRGLDDPDRATDNRELVDDLLGETDRMSAVLSDLLLLARLDADKVSVAREPFDLAAVLSEAAERFAARAAAEDKRLEVRHSGKLPARGDAGRTGQILAALLDNALRFTPPGGLVVLEGHTPDRRVEATVTDTGVGIPPENLPRVFERFYRADPQSAARTRSGGGTGLGLAIARDLARAQGGDLRAENAENGGARFTLTLPT